jgi:hypothetical protein
MEKFWNSMHQEDVKTGLKVKHMYEQLHMNTKTVLRKIRNEKTTLKTESKGMTILKIVFELQII